MWAQVEAGSAEPRPVCAGFCAWTGQAGNRGINGTRGKMKQTGCHQGSAGDRRMWREEMRVGDEEGRAMSWGGGQLCEGCSLPVEGDQHSQGGSPCKTLTAARTHQAAPRLGEFISSLGHILCLPHKSTWPASAGHFPPRPAAIAHAPTAASHVLPRLCVCLGANSCLFSILWLFGDHHTVCKHLESSRAKP